MARGRLRRLILNFHLCLGLVASPILACAGLTGAMLALGPDLDGLLHPALHRVRPAGSPLAEGELLTRVARARHTSDGIPAIEHVEFGGPSDPQVFVLRSGARVYVNPYDGRILGTREGPSRLDRVLADVFQFHVRMMAGNRGQLAVDLATAVALLSVPTGAILWWNRRRIGFRRSAHWRLWTWDLHNAAGFWAGAPLLVLALSGVLVAWERPLYWIARARPEHEPPLPHSAPPANGSAGGAGVDAWLAAAGRALPGLAVDRLWMPSTARSAVQVRMRERDGFERSVVYLDRYDARLLRVDAAASGPRAFRAHVLNRAIHTGDVAGWPSRWLAVFASLAVAVLSGTGAVLWVKKLVR